MAEGLRVNSNNNPRPQCHDPLDQHRCQCGNLLAKIVASGIELKCRRCKRMVVIAFEDVTDWQRTPSPLLHNSRHGRSKCNE